MNDILQQSPVMLNWKKWVLIMFYGLFRFVCIHFFKETNLLSSILFLTLILILELCSNYSSFLLCLGYNSVSFLMRYNSLCPILAVDHQAYLVNRTKSELNYPASPSLSPPTSSNYVFTVPQKLETFFFNDIKVSSAVT